MVCTNHTYASQDPYNPDDKISGGNGPIYAASIVVAMKRMKLKEDDDGNKTSEVMGIRAGCKVVKTRYNKPFEDIQVKIPYATGMDPYSGLFDLFEKSSVIIKEGNRYKYISPVDKTEIKEFRKNWTHEQFNKVMKEWNLIDKNSLKQDCDTQDQTEKPTMEK